MPCGNAAFLFLFLFYLSFLPGTASMPNIESATLTLSKRTVSFPCSNSRTKRRPSPDRIANSSCVRPAARLFCFTKSPMVLIFTPHYKILKKIYTLSGIYSILFCNNIPERVYYSCFILLLYPIRYTFVQVSPAVDFFFLTLYNDVSWKGRPPPGSKTFKKLL